MRHPSPAALRPGRMLLGAAFLARLSGAAAAQTTIIERDEPRAVLIEREDPVVVERRAVVPAVPEGGCERTTTTRTEIDGSSTTVRRERCD